MLDVTVKTMQRWDREGRLVPAGRNASNRRVYTESQIQEFLGLRRYGASEIKAGQVAYCRVSSAAQKPDLQNQRRVLEEFCVARGLANVEFGVGVRARPANGGKVTPVRYEAGLQGASGQEQNAAHFCAHFG